MKLFSNYKSQQLQSIEIGRVIPNSKREAPGFTLVEALVSLAIISTIGLIIATLLQQTFVGNTKTQLLGIVKQNGQNATNFIDSTIRNATAVVCVNTPPGPTTLNNREGDTIVVKTESGTTLTYTRIRITITGITYDQPTPSTPATDYTLCDTSPVPSNARVVINTMTTPPIQINQIDAKPYFNLVRSPGTQDTVMISFALSNKNISSRPEEFSLENFQTSVTLR